MYKLCLHLCSGCMHGFCLKSIWLYWKCFTNNYSFRLHYEIILKIYTAKFVKTESCLKQENFYSSWFSYFFYWVSLLGCFVKQNFLVRYCDFNWVKQCHVIIMKSFFACNSSITLSITLNSIRIGNDLGKNHLWKVSVWARVSHLCIFEHSYSHKSSKLSHIF